MTVAAGQQSQFPSMHFVRSLSITGIVLLYLTIPSLAQESLINLYYSGAYESVIDLADEAIESGDTSVNTHYLKALSEVQMGRAEQAIQTLEDAIGIFPEDIRLQRMLAGQYLDAGVYPEARKLYGRLLQLDSLDISSRLKLAEIASFTQQYDQAVPMLEQVLLLDSANLDGLIMLADIYSRQNDTTAIAYYKKAYEIYPGNQKVAYALSNAYIQANQPDSAVSICDQVLQLDSTNIRFRKLLGYAHYKAGDPRPAIIQFRKASVLGDSTVFTFKFLGIAYYMVVDFQGAIESLQQAVVRDSMDAEIHFFLGASLGTTTRKAAALYHLDRSMVLMKPDPVVMGRIYSEQGNILRLEGKYEAAYDRYKLAWEADSTNPISIYYMASILDNSLHRLKEALADYRYFIEQLDQMPAANSQNDQIPTIRTIVEGRIESLTEELFFLDE